MHEEKNYNELELIWKSYMNTHPNISSFFLKLTPNTNHTYLNNDTIYVKGTESLIPGILKKTIESLKFVINTYEFDYVFRTNASSVLNLNKFYNYILANNNIKCGGIIGTCVETKFISGAGILLNYDICNELVINENQLNYDIIDDVAIGLYLCSKNYNFTPLKRFDFVNDPHLSKNRQNTFNDNYHFRCKCNNYKLTCVTAKNVAKKIYNFL